MTILKQLIENMIGEYLNESYENDLVESIFEEVSEETWEAIEEAILNELSPKTLASYAKKASKSADRLSKSADKYGDKASMAHFDSMAGSGRKALDRATKYSDRADADSKKAANRTQGITRASSAIERQKKDHNELSADDFEKKYRITKSEWMRKNKKNV